MTKKHGNFIPLKPLNSDTRSKPTYEANRFKGTAKLIDRGLQYTYLLKVTDTTTGRVVFTKEVKLNPNGAVDVAIMKARNLASDFRTKVFRSKAKR